MIAFEKFRKLQLVRIIYLLKKTEIERGYMTCHAENLLRSQGSLELMSSHFLYGAGTSSEAVFCLRFWPPA